LDIYLKRNQTTLFLNHYQNSVGINYARHTVTQMNMMKLLTDDGRRLWV